VRSCGCENSYRTSCYIVGLLDVLYYTIRYSSVHADTSIFFIYVDLQLHRRPVGAQNTYLQVVYFKLLKVRTYISAATAAQF